MSQKHKLLQREITIQHQQNANTMRQTQNLNDVFY